MYINDTWKSIDAYSDYIEAQDLRLTTASFTKSNGKLYMIPIIFDNTPSSTTLSTLKAPPLIIYDCESATFVSHKSYEYMPIEAMLFDYGGYSCLTSTKTHVYVIGGRPKSIPIPTESQWETLVIDKLQIYNISGDQWSYGQPIPVQGIKTNGIESPACSIDAQQENIYVFGGKDDFTNATKNIYKYIIQKLLNFFVVL